ncbi:MAG: fused MFS/spermidine synthase [Planctomycetes bacterium]|nr:fused MFS/spermidine synthase [Planctomycetota bacterium]
MSGKKRERGDRTGARAGAPRGVGLALAAFFLSGASGLIYEVIWVRLIGTTMGSSHDSLTTVVAVFMGGLAIGSVIGGRIADRSPSPLRLYGRIVIAIGIAGAAVPILIPACRPLFSLAYRIDPDRPTGPLMTAVRVLACGAILLIPTTLMGATLPALSRHVTRSLGEVGRRVGALYAVNTFGAVAGALAAGFLLIPVLGLWGSTATAAALDIGAGLVVLVRTRGERGAARGADPVRSPEQGSAPRERRLPPEVRLAVIAFGISGFVNMALQIAWTRALVANISNSTFAFSTIVAVYILGIGIGGAAAGRIADRIRNPVAALGWILVGIAAWSLLSIPILGILPLWIARLFASWEPSFGAYVRLMAGVSAAILLPATILMGAAFPLASRIRARDEERVGTAVGAAYFANTLGSILGTLVAGFVLIPLFDVIWKTMLSAIALGLAAGLALVTSASKRRRIARFVPAAATVAFLGAVFLPLRPSGFLGRGDERMIWHPAVMSCGPYLYGRFLCRGTEGLRDLGRKIIRRNEILSYRDEPTGSVAVVRLRGASNLAIRLSGKVDASIGEAEEGLSDQPAFLLAGHLPMLVQPDPRAVLTLGLGGGATLGAFLRHGEVERIDSLEISEEVIRAARTYFGEAHGGAIDDPRVHHILGDGRNHLLYTERFYDVISSQPSNPWIAGIGSLFTVEYFETCRARLREGGVMCQWIHTLAILPEDLWLVVRTFASVFPYVSLWDIGYDVLLIGSEAPVPIDRDRIAAKLSDARVGPDLVSVGISSPEAFVRFLRFETPGLRERAGEGPLNRDSLPILEFRAPRGIFGVGAARRYDAIIAVCPEEIPPLPEERLVGFSGAERAQAERSRRAMSLLGHVVAERTDVYDAYLSIAKLGDSWVLSQAGMTFTRALARAREAPRYDPSQAAQKLRPLVAAAPNERLAREFAHVLREKADRELREDPAGAMRDLEEAMRLDPRDAEAPSLLGRIFMLLGKGTDAERVFDEALRRRPGDLPLAVQRAIAIGLQNRLADARAALEEILPRIPEGERALRAEVLTNIGTTLRKEGKFDEALVLYERACAADPTYADGHANRARVLEAGGDAAGALEAMRRAAALAPEKYDRALREMEGGAG